MSVDVNLSCVSSERNEYDRSQIRGKKRSYLVLRKDGGKLRILQRSLLDKPKNNSERNVENTEVEEVVVYGDISIKSEDIVRDIDEHSSFSDFNLSDSDYELEHDVYLRNKNESPSKESSVCEICGLKFKSRNALTSHRKWKHLCKVKHECSFCGKPFRDSFCLKRHLNNVHTKDGQIRDNFRSLKCFLCDFKATEGVLVNMHYGKVHGYNTTEQKIRFSSVDEFENWKIKVETDTKSKFVKLRGSRTNLNGTTVTVYNCHRSGYYNSSVKDQRLRKIKAKGSNKINGYCPATISSIVYNNQVIVTYVPLHVGHDLDLSKLSLSNQEKEFIAEKLSNNIPMEQILEDLNQSYELNSSDIKRINLANRKDFYNIIQKYQLKGAVYSQSKSEWRKLQAWVEEIHDQDNIIKFYKPHGQIVLEYQELKSEDFCLLLASDCQLELLKKYNNNVICVDNVSKVNASDFELYSILVLDEFRESYPCAFILSSRVDDNALRIYFKIIKSLVGCELCPRHFVSDYANSIYNAWSSIFLEKPISNLFSCLNIEFEWKRNLSKIKTKEKQLEVFEKVKPLIYVKNFNDFGEQASNLMKELTSDIETRLYSNYLSKFLLDTQPWASCYRLNAEINNCLNIEGLHHEIDYYQAKGKKVKSLTKTVKALLKYSNKKIDERLTVSYQELVGEKLNIITSRHRMSLELIDSVIEILDNGWNVIVSGDTDTKNFVYKDDIGCACSLMCSECNVCIHAYSCTCSDAIDLFNMCQHVHLIVACLQNNTLIDTVKSNVLEVEVVGNECLETSSENNYYTHNYSNNLNNYEIDVIYNEENETFPKSEFKIDDVSPENDCLDNNEANGEVNNASVSSLQSYFSLNGLKLKKETFAEKEGMENVKEVEQIALEVVVES